MALDITKPGIDLGIVTANGEAMVAFYGETLGLEHVGELKVGGGTVMQRFQCGDSVVKVLVLPGEATATAAPGGINGATGYRYFTITVGDINGSVAACEAAGATIAVPVMELRPGITIAMVEDPDGNWVELLAG
jgi:catechol 2,3-dioxygenase-like lactoylglutathione lyase family enzyme